MSHNDLSNPWWHVRVQWIRVWVWSQIPKRSSVSIPVVPVSMNLAGLWYPCWTLVIPISCGHQETAFSIVLLIQLPYILFYPFSVLLQPPNSPFLFYLKNFYPKRTNYCSHDATICDLGSLNSVTHFFPIIFFYLNTVHIDTKKLVLFPLIKCSKKWNKSLIKILAHLKRSLNCPKTTIHYNSILINITV